MAEINVSGEVRATGLNRAFQITDHAVGGGEGQDTIIQVTFFVKLWFPADLPADHQPGAKAELLVEAEDVLRKIVAEQTSRNAESWKALRSEVSSSEIRYQFNRQ